MRSQDRRIALLFLLPAVLGLLAFKIIPVAASIGMSFTEWGLFSAPRFIGLDNYVKALTEARFYLVLFHTLYLALGVQLLTFVFGLAFALMLNTALRGTAFYRTIYFIPFVTAWAAVALVWKWLFDTSAGPINLFLGLFGIQPIPWLTSPEWALPAVIITVAWKNFGFKMVIFLAGLQNIPTEYYEAAEIDGARSYQKLRYITLPLLTPAIFLSIVVGLIGVLQLFDPILLMTEGGPARATENVGYYIYFVGFRRLEMGYAAAISWLLFVIILVVTLIQWRLQRRWVFYQ